MTHTDNALWGLPDPAYQPEYYESVALKRLMAWGVDVVVIFTLSVLASLLSFGIGFFLFGLVYFSVGFVYRVITISGRSATLGMRLMAIELRTHRGDRFDPMTAIFHTLGYYISMATFLLQLISLVMMFTTPRGQGLIDMVLGTTALNRQARQ
ncbi:RDD family protein [Aliiroseovarius crassostreae]|uniref:RDD family protein n=1 Tax=Aliiroseovarius crassostreae TaxID=154981 RepID=UPI00220DFB7A|nr:RDD family protein [Aliiroseovarius crassostreae]UWQ06713.1 RDD family protein [Aliiroseovarius crassostreae]UWQ09815.1 RDD family protein [Aliiroseovarius crassostreae]